MRYICELCLVRVTCSSDPFTVEMDASGSGVGEVLNVIWDGRPLPVAYFSR